MDEKNQRLRKSQWTRKIDVFEDHNGREINVFENGDG
jgi:hypothetical protein